jgi:hypothetical protein
VLTSFALVLLGACGAESNSEIAPLGCGDTSGMTPGSGNSPGSSPNKPIGSGGTGSGGTFGTGSGGTSTGTGGTTTPGQAGSTSVAGTAGSSTTTPGNACDATSFTDAIHVVMDVTWAGTSSRQAGSGQIHTWNRLKLSTNGSDISGKMRPCGTILPPTQLTALAGGKKVLIELPDSIWDSAEMPEFDVKGTLSGGADSASVKMNWISTVGITLADVSGAWPKTGKEVQASDVDGDGKPGYSSVPRDGGDYTLPPTSLSAAIAGPWADRVYLVSRHIMAVDGARAACDRAAGAVQVDAFDSHVVGCHLKGAGECDDAQAKFVDENRMIYTVKSATFTLQRVADAATCADVRAAAP